MPLVSPLMPVPSLVHSLLAVCVVFSGDVVVSRSMSDPNQLVCKRVRGLEGDNVAGCQGSSLWAVWNNMKVVVVFVIEISDVNKTKFLRPRQRPK